MSTIVKIDISDVCLESYPCQHTVNLTYSDGTVKTGLLMDGVAIYELLKSLGRPIDRHFVGYEHMVD